jgi:hypothetical protein
VERVERVGRLETFDMKRKQCKSSSGQRDAK